MRRRLAWGVGALLVTACASGGTGTEDAGSGGGDDAATVENDAGETGLCADRDCSHLDDVCVVGACRPDTGACEAEPRPDGTACDDGDACTMDDACAAGTCAGAARDCSAMDTPCAAGVCDPETGACEAMVMPDGTACEDGDLCTEGDECTSGTCVTGAPVDCSAASGGCNLGTCDPATGACTMMPVADGTTCDDGDPCTAGDACASGACDGAAVDCSALTDACNVGVCDATGDCVAMPVADGTTCDDANDCTTGDACSAGTCAGTPITTGPCAEATVDFPAAGDTRMGAGGGVYFWRAGDYVEGARTTSLPSITQADISVQIDPNVLSCDTQDVEMRINGTTVGSFSISSTDGVLTRSFTFPAIAGPTYTLRYHTVRSVSSGCGSAGYSDAGSTVTLRP
ncbi:MAG TPA: hypothetical protein RMH99_32795 [Sandaracinaceae bacterium LLY-WYZ-13_1]|nr:hypothetical protein [Sandaracinaceae bacterium LLY-WYZ-13_1]